MLNPRPIWNRLASFAGLALPALLMVVPNAFAMPEGGGRVPLEEVIVTRPSGQSAPEATAVVDATSNGFDWVQRHSSPRLPSPSSSPPSRCVM